MNRTFRSVSCRLEIRHDPMRWWGNNHRSPEAYMKETRRVLFKKGVFVCPKCRQSYVQEKWIEEWRIRCHKCDYRGTLTEVSVEELMDEETMRHRQVVITAHTDASHSNPYMIIAMIHDISD